MTDNIIKLNSEKVRNTLATKAPEWVSDHFANQVISAIQFERQKNEELKKCSEISFIDCAKEAASIGLIPSRVTGHAYLVPFKGKCTLIIGYKGLITLLCRNKDIQSVHARIVREGDKFEPHYGTEDKIVHIPTLNEKNPITHVYAIITYKSGLKQFEIMTKQEVGKVKAKSKSQYFWKDYYEAMALKTVIRRLAKYVPSNSIYEQFLNLENKQEEMLSKEDEKIWEGDYVEQQSDDYLIKELENENE